MAGIYETLAASIVQNDGSALLNSASNAMDSYVKGVKARGDTLTQGFKDLGTGMDKMSQAMQGIADNEVDNAALIKDNAIDIANNELARDDKYYSFLDQKVESKHIDNARAAQKAELDALNANWGLTGGSQQAQSALDAELDAVNTNKAGGLSNSDIIFYLKNPQAYQIAVEKGDLKNNTVAQNIIQAAAIKPKVNEYLEKADRLYQLEQEIEQGVFSPGRWRDIASNIYNDPEYNNRAGLSKQDLYATLMDQQNKLTNQKGTFADMQQVWRAQQHVNNAVNGVNSILGGANNSGANGGGNTSQPNGGAGASVNRGGNNAAVQQPQSVTPTNNVEGATTTPQMLDGTQKTFIASEIDKIPNPLFSKVFGMTKEEALQDIEENGSSGKFGQTVQRYNAYYGSDGRQEAIKNLTKEQAQNLDEMADINNSEFSKYAQAVANIGMLLVPHKAAAVAAKTGKFAVGGIANVATKFGLPAASLVEMFGLGVAPNGGLTALGDEYAKSLRSNPLYANQYGEIDRYDEQIRDLQKKSSSMNPAEYQQRLDDLTKAKQAVRSEIAEKQKKWMKILEDPNLSDDEKVTKINEEIERDALAEDRKNRDKNIANQRKIEGEQKRLERIRDDQLRDIASNRNKDLDAINKMHGVSADAKDKARLEVLRKYSDAENRVKDQFKNDLEDFKKAHPTNYKTDRAVEMRQKAQEFEKQARARADAKIKELEKQVANMKEGKFKDRVKARLNSLKTSIKNSPGWAKKKIRQHPILTGVIVVGAAGGYALDEYIDNEATSWIRDEFADMLDRNFGVGKVGEIMTTIKDYNAGRITEEEFRQRVIASGELTEDDQSNFWIEKGDSVGEDVTEGLKQMWNMFGGIIPFVPEFQLKNDNWKSYVNSYNQLRESFITEEAMKKISYQFDNPTSSDPHSMASLANNGSLITKKAANEVNAIGNGLYDNGQNGSGGIGSNPRDLGNDARARIAAAEYEAATTADAKELSSTLTKSIIGSENQSQLLARNGEEDEVTMAMFSGVLKEKPDNIYVGVGANSRPVFSNRGEKNKINTNIGYYAYLYGEENAKSFMKAVHSAASTKFVLLNKLMKSLNMGQAESLALIDKLCHDKDLIEAYNTFYKNIQTHKNATPEQKQQWKKDLDIASLTRIAAVMSEINAIAENGGGDIEINNGKKVRINNMIQTNTGKIAGSIDLAALAEANRRDPEWFKRAINAGKSYLKNDVPKFVNEYMSLNPSYVFGGLADQELQAHDIYLNEKKLGTADRINVLMNLQ